MTFLTFDELQMTNMCFNKIKKETLLDGVSILISFKHMMY